MKKKIIIHEGFTNNYLMPGGVLIMGSFIIFILYDINFLIPAVVFGLILISGSNGLEIDLKKNRFRKYGSFLGLKIGKWKTLQHILEGKLALSSASSSFGGTTGGMAGTYMPNKGSLKSMTYDVYVNTKIDGWVRLYDFLAYNTAKKALKELEIVLEIPVSDKVREKLNENRENRKSSRR